MFDQLMENLTFATKPRPVEATTHGILCMGGTGSGKTRFSSTAERPILALDFDHGLQTYVSEGLVAGTDYFPYTFEKFDFKDVKTPKGLKRTLVPRPNIDETLQLLSWAADKSGPFAPDGIMGGVKTIVVDGFTAVSDYFLYEIMTSRLGLNYDNDKPGFEGYGQLLRALSNLTELLIKCKEHYHVIGTVLVKWEQRPGSNRDGDTVGTPQMDGSFRGMVGKFLDEFYFFDSQKVGMDMKYFAYAKPLPTIPGLKTRSQLEAKIEDPTFKKVQAGLAAAHTKGGQR